MALPLACNQTGPSAIPTPVTSTPTIEGPALVPPGSTATFRAIVRSHPDQRSNDVSTQVQWLTSNPAVLAIDGGVATAYGPGSVILEVRYDDQRSTRPVLVATEFPDSPARAIALGETVTGRITQDERTQVLELIPPADGTLVVRLTWTPSPNGTFMWLVLGETAFRSESVWNPPAVARWPVTAGRAVRMTVLAGSDWILDDPFVLTTELQ